jgi:small subunit ribosomal protein S6e
VQALDPGLSAQAAPAGVAVAVAAVDRTLRVGDEDGHAGDGSAGRPDDGPGRFSTFLRTRGDSTRMADFQVVVADPESGASYKIDVDGQDGNRFLGRDIGEKVDGGAVGLTGYTVEITGGSDDTGRPMREDVGGPGLTAVLLSGGVGFNPTVDGERKRVTVRGREISENIRQINAEIATRGGESPESLLGLEDEE